MNSWSNGYGSVESNSEHKMSTTSFHPGITRQIGRDRVWIDPYGRGSVALGDGDKCLEESFDPGLVEKIDEIYRQLGVPFSYRVSIIIDGRVLGRMSVATAVRKLCATFSPGQMCNLEVHYPVGQTPEIDRLILFTQSLRALRVTHPVLACGRFSIATTQQMEEMFDVACLGMYVVNDQSPRFDESDGEVVASFTDFGFLMPVRFFVGANSLPSIEEDIPKALASNRSAGFSVPLVSESPFFDVARDAVPAPAEYSNLLVRIYQSYPWFDGWLEPIAGLAMSFRSGGSFSRIDQTHFLLNFLIDQNGDIFKSRRIPRFGVKLASIDEVSDAEPDSIRDLVVARGLGSLNRACQPCEWRCLCGGVDAHNAHPNRRTDSANVEQVFLATCQYRILFLEYFAGRLPIINPDSSFNQENSA